MIHSSRYSNEVVIKTKDLVEKILEKVDFDTVNYHPEDALLPFKLDNSLISLTVDCYIGESTWKEFKCMIINKKVGVVATFIFNMKNHYDTETDEFIFRDKESLEEFLNNIKKESFKAMLIDEGMIKI